MKIHLIVISLAVVILSLVACSAPSTSGGGKQIANENTTKVIKKTVHVGDEIASNGLYTHYIYGGKVSSGYVIEVLYQEHNMVTSYPLYISYKGADVSLPDSELKLQLKREVGDNIVDIELIKSK